MALTITLTVAFGSSVRLAGAYGTAVSTTMLLTTVLLYNVMRIRWRWPAAAAGTICGIFLLIDCGFFAANLLKLAQGGWIPLTLGAIVFIIMTTWHAGIEAVREKLEAMKESPGQFFRRLTENKIPRVPGTGVFLTSMTELMPPPIIDHVAQVGALYENLVALTVAFDEVPRVQSAKRMEIVKIVENFWHITIHYGFIEVPNLPSLLEQAKGEGIPIDLNNAIYFASRDQVIRSKSGKSVMRWRLPLFAFMYRNALRMSDLFNLPSRNFLEIGRQVEI
jgi:KUP system potassium uptake protein